MMFDHDLKRVGERNMEERKLNKDQSKLTCFSGQLASLVGLPGGSHRKAAGIGNCDNKKIILARKVGEMHNYLRIWLKRKWWPQ